jgi:hypothetical protein
MEIYSPPVPARSVPPPPPQHNYVSDSQPERYVPFGVREVGQPVYSGPATFAPPSQFEFMPTDQFPDIPIMGQDINQGPPPPPTPAQAAASTSGNPFNEPESMMNVVQPPPRLARQTKGQERRAKDARRADLWNELFLERQAQASKRAQTLAQARDREPTEAEKVVENLQQQGLEPGQVNLPPDDEDW